MKTEPSAVAHEDQEWLLDELHSLRQQLAALEQRVARLELVEEIWQKPQAAGDQEIEP